VIPLFSSAQAIGNAIGNAIVGKTMAANVIAVNALLAADDELGIGLMLRHLVAAVVFAVVGIVVLAISFWLMEKLTPFSIVKEIEEDQNVALAVIVGAVVIGVSVIIAAAILG